MSKYLALLLGTLVLSSGAWAADFSQKLLAAPDWEKKIRSDHPRLFLNAGMLPSLRERARTVNADHFARIKQEVDALPADAPMLFVNDPMPRNADGSIKIQPAQQGYTLFRYDGSNQAVRCALVYLVTEDPAYAAKAKNYLSLAVKVMQWTAANNVWQDSGGHTRINALAAYDWIHNTLTPQERREILLPILDYTTEAQQEGSYKFRRTFGGATDGNYGEVSLLYFAGLTGYGDGVDDARCADFLKRGAKVFVDMLNYRESSSNGSGVLSALTPGYSFGNYPYATFLFFYSWQSAFGVDLTARWSQMADFPNWFDFLAIRQGRQQDLLDFGIGDGQHTDNAFPAWAIYTHLSQSIHFYSKSQPEKARRAYAALSDLPPQRRVMSRIYPFLPFLLTGFDAREIELAAAAQPASPPYFYADKFGLLISRSGRTADDTYVSFRIGAGLENHQHYDELSFVIYKNGFLALDSGSRTETDHHHNFAPQSVAHNTILIHQEKEPMPPFWTSWSHKPDGKVYYNHGGQNNLSKCKALKIEGNDQYIYAAGDATGSYAASKAGEVVRQFVYIKPDYFVIYDRVASVKPEQKKEFLLHFQQKPVGGGDNKFHADNGGRLFVTTLLPAKPEYELVGGPGREFWASGRNWELDGGENWDKQYRTTGKWRLEVSDPAAKTDARFLHFLQASEPESTARVEPEYFRDGNQDGVCFTDRKGQKWEIRFNRAGDVDCKIKRI